MAQGDGKRVGGVGRGCRIEPQQNLHHVLDLGLVGAAEPHDAGVLLIPTV